MIIGEKFVFVRNPKTASTACGNTLLQSGDWNVVQAHRHHTPYLGSFTVNGTLRPVRGVVVRNPFDRMVSGYYGNRPEGSFLKWLMDKDPWLCGPSIDFKRTPQLIWTNECTHILRYENLQEDFEKFCKDAGVPFEELLVQNVSGSREGKSYRDVIGSPARRIIEDRFGPDFQEFGYQW